MSGGVLYELTDWDRIKKLGLHPRVSSPEGYAARVLMGMRLAEATLAETKEVVPRLSTIRGLHYIMFEGVHPWAGTFRQPGHEVEVGRLMCSLAKDVPKELMKLRKEMIDNPLKGSRQYRADVIAFYHASFLEIHPFADGNGRVARTILDYQTRRLLGHPLSQHIGRSEYVEALSMAQGRGELAPLAKLVMRNDLNRARCSNELKQREVVLGEPLVSKAIVLDERGHGRG